MESTPEDEMNKVFNKYEDFKKVENVIKVYKDTIPEDCRDTLDSMYRSIDRLRKKAEDLYMGSGARDDTDASIVQELQKIGEVIDYRCKIVEDIGFGSINTAKRANNQDDTDTMKEIETLIENSHRYEFGCSCKRTHAGEDVVKFEVTCFLKPGLYHP